MKHQIEKKEEYAIITLEEEKLDATISPELKALMSTIVSEGVKNIILNLKNVKYADSSGLSAILVGNRVCDASDGVFIICDLSDMVKKLISISKLDSVLNTLPTQAEAIDAVFFAEIEAGLGDEEE